MYDVIIISDNLAGATVAINTASKGVNVALVERNKDTFLSSSVDYAYSYAWLKNDLIYLLCRAKGIYNKESDWAYM